MKFQTLSQLLAISMVASPAIAMPSLLNHDSNLLNRADKPKKVAFDKSQLVSVSGFNKFMAPGPLDERGPCPGLNAMANHNYLPRSGVATIVNIAAACEKVFGMGSDLATILAAYGGLFDGVGVIWSIGGQQHTGIGGSHNNYETDSSPMRADLNQYGSNTKLVMSQFQEFYDMQPDAATANYNLDVIKDFRIRRLQESVAKNPYFFYGPFSGTVVSQAAFVFIYRFMANKSAEAPEGILNKEVLKSFMSIKGPEDNLKWVPGHERIPNNWYTRNADDTYGLQTGIGKDIGFMSEGHPEVAMPGCNQGKVNTFVNIDVTNLTKGAYDPNDVLTNPLCFGLAYANVQGNMLPVVNFAIQELILPIQNLLGCKTIPSLDTTVAKACPGYSFYGGPTGKVAPGAIQN